MDDELEIEIGISSEMPELKEPPTESNQLAKKWQGRIAHAMKHYEKFHKRIKFNRNLVAGFNWTKDPQDDDFYTHRANLIASGIQSFVQSIYARNPEISAVPQLPGKAAKLLGKTLTKVVNRQLTDADLKQRAKSTVRAALTCSFGAAKVMYQREMRNDPLIQSRIQDAQDNLVRVQSLLLSLNDDTSRADQERLEAELKETIAALEEQSEIVAAEGMVIDRILTENILVDPAVTEFSDYPNADWIAQIVPMKRTVAQGLYGYKLDKAKIYKTNQAGNDGDSRIYSATGSKTDDDEQICILEIWDKQSHRVYTMAEGCDFWLRDPYTPQTGERWYPFFLLSLNQIDGKFIGPSFVDLTGMLQKEHNDARDAYNAHRELVKPGYIASDETDQKTLRNFTDANLGEVTLVRSDGRPLNLVLVPKQHPPFDQAAYDTTQVRVDWEVVTGQQDAARSTVVKPKTATEASIMQQSLGNRIAEFRDAVEDFTRDIAQYTCEILLQEFTVEQVEKIMGPHKTGPIPGTEDEMTGQPMLGVIEYAYQWPELTKGDVFNLVELQIRAGTSGEPDRLEQQEIWTRLIPLLLQLMDQIMKLQAGSMDASPFIALLKETVGRFDDRIDPEEITPNIQPPPAQPQMQGDAGGADMSQLAAMIAQAQGQQPTQGV